MRARDVCIHPGDDVAGEHVQALPEALALSAVRARLGKDLVMDEDRHPFVRRDLARAILRARVDHHQLVYEREPPDQPRTASPDDTADRALFLDDLHRLARPRDDALDALVVGAFAEQLIKGRTPAAALGDVEQGDRATVRARQVDAGARGQLRVATAADGDKDPLGPAGRALHHRDVAGRIAKDLLDGGPEHVPARAAPADEQ